MKAAIYCRVSTNQETEGTSPQTQREACCDYFQVRAEAKAEVEYQVVLCRNLPN